MTPCDWCPSPAVELGEQGLVCQECRGLCGNTVDVAGETVFTDHMTKTATRRTEYQATHLPVSKVEVLCTGRDLDDRGRCARCGLWTEAAERNGRMSHDHKPNETGSLGWVLTWANGSQRIEGQA